MYDKICTYYVEKVVPYLDTLLGEKIEDYISFCDSKTNINVVITYDEKNNQTNITMATPLMMEDF